MDDVLVVRLASPSQHLARVSRRLHVQPVPTVRERLAVKAKGEGIVKTTYYMPRTVFEDERGRRALLAIYRERAAKRWGLHGRVSFGWYSVHGRPASIVCVTFHPRKGEA